MKNLTFPAKREHKFCFALPQGILESEIPFLYDQYSHQDYSNPPLSMEDTFQEPQWKPETTDSTKSYIYCLFL